MRNERRPGVSRSPPVLAVEHAGFRLNAPVAGGRLFSPDQCPVSERREMPAVVRRPFQVGDNRSHSGTWVPGLRAPVIRLSPARLGQPTFWPVAAARVARSRGTPSPGVGHARRYSFRPGRRGRLLLLAPGVEKRLAATRRASLDIARCANPSTTWSTALSLADRR